VTIEGLEPNFEYKIRAIIVEKDGRSSNIGVEALFKAIKPGGKFFKNSSNLNFNELTNVFILGISIGVIIGAAVGMLFVLLAIFFAFKRFNPFKNCQSSPQAINTQIGMKLL